MPEGPPPGARDSDDDSDDSDDSDDIPLPAGPPPPRIPTQLPPIHMTGNMPPGGYTGFAAPMQSRPPPQANHRPGFRPPHQGPGPRPPAYSAGPSAGPSHALPPRPPTGIITSQPSTIRPPTIGPSTASTPNSTSSASASGTGSSAVTAVYSAEPQLRDLRKEATAFVPRGIKRKKGPTVNATPGAGEVDDQGDSVRVKRDDGPGLMGKLQSVLGVAPASVPGAGSAGGKGSGAGASGGGEDDDYQNFLKGLGDLA